MVDIPMISVFFIIFTFFSMFLHPNMVILRILFLVELSSLWITFYFTYVVMVGSRIIFLGNVLIILSTCACDVVVSLTIQLSLSRIGYYVGASSLRLCRN